MPQKNFLSNIQVGVLMLKLTQRIMFLLLLLPTSELVNGTIWLIYPYTRQELKSRMIIMSWRPLKGASLWALCGICLICYDKVAVSWVMYYDVVKVLEIKMRVTVEWQEGAGEEAVSGVSDGPQIGWLDSLLLAIDFWESCLWNHDLCLALMREHPFIWHHHSILRRPLTWTQ